MKNIVVAVFLLILSCVSFDFVSFAQGQQNPPKQNNPSMQKQEFTPTGNPIFTHKFTCDPAPVVIGDTLWLGTGHDAAGGQSRYVLHDWCIFSTKDMKTWTEYPTPLAVSDFSWDRSRAAYAAQMIPRNGKYYWFISTGKSGIGVAVSDKPEGPYKDAIGKPLLTKADCIGATHGWVCIDPTVFIDDDDQAWLFWGNRYCYFAKLKPNMIELDGPIKQVKLKENGMPFEEAPWIHKYNGKYYLTYASGFPEKLAYAISDKIDGEYDCKGILAEVSGNSNTTHPGIVQFKGKWYLFTHNGAIQRNGTSCSRSVCVEELTYKSDGTINRVHLTTEGIYSKEPK